MRPCIGITGPDKGGGGAWYFTALQVWLAGGRPKRIRPSKVREARQLDGLILGGGADINPAAYTQEDFIQTYLEATLQNKRKSFFRRITSFFGKLAYPVVFLLRKFYSRKGWALDEDRDKLEFKLLHDAVELGLPVLGICRGAQLINVYFEGTLFDDIGTFYFEEPNPSSIFPVKVVNIKPESKLERILGRRRLAVNALHHQAVKEPGEGIAIVAWERNNVVQAIESTQRDFIIGVQWHPEYLIQKKQQRRLFSALIDAACHVKRRRNDKKHK